MTLKAIMLLEGRITSATWLCYLEAMCNAVAFTRIIMTLISLAGLALANRGSLALMGNTCRQE
jgi:hypothetical protein